MLGHEQVVIRTHRGTTYVWDDGTEIRNRDNRKEVSFISQGVSVVIGGYKPTKRSMTRHDVLHCYISFTGDDKCRQNWSIQTGVKMSHLQKTWGHEEKSTGRLGDFAFVEERVNELLGSEEFRKSLKRRLTYTIKKAAKLERERRTNAFYEKNYYSRARMEKYWKTRQKSYYRRIAVFAQLMSE